jgi:hypothetical protein
MVLAKFFAAEFSRRKNSRKIGKRGPGGIHGRSGYDRDGLRDVQKIEFSYGSVI